MTEPSASDAPQPNLLQRLTEAAKKAFDPSGDDTSREAGFVDYQQILANTQTWTLLHALNSLIKPGVLPPWLSKPFMEALTMLPLRPDGVRASMEFVFSVHPSNENAKAESAESQKQGAGITHEAVAVATKLLSSVPASMTPQAWFEGISGQMFDLVDGKDGPDLARTTAQIVGFGILGRKSLGAPGEPGWNVFVRPLLEDLNPSLRADPLVSRNNDPPSIVDLSRARILTSAEALEQSLKRLQVLVVSNPSPGLCRRLMKPVIIQLWILASQLPTRGDDPCTTAAGALLQIYMRLFGNATTMTSLRQNVLCKGSLSADEVQWHFQTAVDGKTQIVVQRPGSEHDVISWVEIEAKTSVLVDIMQKVCSAEDVSALFRDLLRYWIMSVSETEEINLSTTHGDDDTSSAMQQLFEMTLLQKLLERAPEKLVSDFDQLLELICHVFRGDEKVLMADELMGVVLSLLNLVITAPTFKKSDIKAEELAIVQAGLDRLSKAGRTISQTASNLLLLLTYRTELEEETTATSAPSKRQVEERRTYNLAMNYITEGDNPPPVVSEGLGLLAGLIASESTVLDITATLVLMSNLLANHEDYINLRVVNMFTQLAAKHPKSTVTELLDHYVDSQEKSSTDNRLRFGEALLQVIERLGETFTGAVAQQVGEALLSIAGRRGYRPKTKAKKAREEKMRELKRKKGEDEDDDDDDLEGNEIFATEEETANNEILAQIVQGWDSKRGAEDIRMRASALSIFGRALETNISGLGPTVASGGVDLCVNIMTLEPEMERAILRRSAIIAVLSFVRGLQQAKDSGRSLGFGLTDPSRQDITRTLEYIVGTDNDGLVQQHARDVIESLENWQMTTLLPQQSTDGVPGLGRLAGLNVDPDITSATPAGHQRPRIEEIE